VHALERLVISSTIFQCEEESGVYEEKAMFFVLCVTFLSWWGWFG